MSSCRVLLIALLIPSALLAQSVDWQEVVWREPQVRYLLADMMLGGSREFYWRTAEAAHEMGCLEAVLRYDTGVKITNLDAFERK